MRRFFILSTLFASLSVCAFADSKESLKEQSYTQNVEKKVITIDLKNAFNASPIIYSILFGLSVASFTVALSAYIDISKKLYIPKETLEKVKEKLVVCRYDEATSYLESKSSACALMIKNLIESRKQGTQAARESMKLAGKRCMVGSWQKISILSDIALLAPMIGLLGTVLGMFYAFYDVNRSIESLASLFDGLGVSVGTTVAGLLVALSSMAMQTVLKHKLISGSNRVEIACEEATSYIGQ